jgi:hypothetical protein
LNVLQQDSVTSKVSKAQMKTRSIFISFTCLSVATVSLVLLVVNRLWANEQSQGTSSVINGRTFERLESDNSKRPSNGSQLPAESGTNLWRERVTLARMARFPELAPLYFERVRRQVMHRFPFGIFDEPHPTRVLVVNSGFAPRPGSEL